MIESDGIALTSAAHPSQAWYRRVWFHVWLRWRAPKLNPASLETIKIELPERK